MFSKVGTYIRNNPGAVITGVLTSIVSYVIILIFVVYIANGTATTSRTNGTN